MPKSIEGKANKTLEFNEDVNFWKMSLGNSQNPNEDFDFDGIVLKTMLFYLVLANGLILAIAKISSKISKTHKKRKDGFFGHSHK